MFERKKWRKYQSDIDDAREDDQLDRERIASKLKLKYGPEDFARLERLPRGKMIFRDNHAAVRHEYYKRLEALPDNDQSYRQLLSRFSEKASEERKAMMARIVTRLATERKT